MKKNYMKRLFSVLIAFAVAFSCIPAMAGQLDSYAASMAKPGKVKSLKLSCTSTGYVKLSWSKAKGSVKGYVVYRDGKRIAWVSKSKRTYYDKKVQPGTTYKYYVKAYNKKKAWRWYNKKTGKYQKKKPAKKYRGKHKKVNIYKYGAKSSTKTITVSDYLYKVSGKTVTLTAYRGDDSDLKIPSRINGKKVTKIGDACFRGNAYIKTVEMPDTVTAIGDYAFEANGAMTAVKFSSKLKSIGKGAFSGCASLKEITVPESTESIGDGAFLYCMGAKKLTVKGKIKKLGQFAFAGMEDLESAELDSDSAVALPDRLFCNCKALREVKINGVTSVGKRAFSNCQAVESIDIEGPIKNVGDYAFEKCCALNELSLISTDSSTDIKLGGSILRRTPDIGACSVTLGGNAVMSFATFKDSTLEDLKLSDGSTLMIVEDGTETDCTVKDGMLLADKGSILLTVMPAAIKQGSDGKTTCTVPEGTRVIKDGAFVYQTFNSLQLPESITEIENGAFRSCFFKSVSVGSDNEGEAYIVENNALYEKIASDGETAVSGDAKAAAVNETAAEEAVTDGEESVEGSAPKEDAAEAAEPDEAAAGEEEAAEPDEAAVDEAAKDETSSEESVPVETAEDEETVNEDAAKDAAAGEPASLYRLIRYCRPGKASTKAEFIIPDNVVEIAPYAFCGCGVNTTVLTGPKSSSALKKICDNAFDESGLMPATDPDLEDYLDIYGTFGFDSSWTEADIKALGYDEDKAFENKYYYPPDDEEEERDSESSEEEREEYPEEDPDDDYMYDESDGYNKPRRDEDIPDEPAGTDEDVPTYTSLAGDKSLFDESKFSSYKDTGSDFTAWSEEYLKYNSDNKYIDLSPEIVPYTMLYKGEEHYRTMVCVLNDDDYKKAHSIREVGDDYFDMYMMMDHGLFAELERSKMPCDIMLYSGITVERAAQIAGKGKNDSYTTQDLIDAIGSTYTEKAMMSTTANWMTAVNFSPRSKTMVMIYASKDAIDEVGATNIDCMESIFQGEQEILISNNAKYRILDVGEFKSPDGEVDFDRTVIKLELLGKE